MCCFKTGQTLLFIIYIFVLSCNGVNEKKTMKKQTDIKITYQLVSDNSYKIGEPVGIRFILSNNSGKSVYILKWYTPLEGVLGNIFNVTKDGKPVLYEGMLVKRGAADSLDYVKIRTGESVSNEIDLTKVYNLTRAGLYKIGFRGILYDVIFADNLNDITFPRKQDEHRSLKIKGNFVSLKIIK